MKERTKYALSVSKEEVWNAYRDTQAERSKKSHEKKQEKASKSQHKRKPGKIPNRRKNIHTDSNPRKKQPDHALSHDKIHINTTQLTTKKYSKNTSTIPQ